MALLGGKVACRSRFGRGSVFELNLPLDKKPRATGQHHAADKPPTAANAEFAAGKRIVVLEDDQLISDAMRFLLQAMGAEVRLFDNAEEALQQDDIGDADYFIVDHSLGGKLSGLQFLEAVQRQRHDKLRAVILTGETSSRFLSSVADSPWPVLNKPVSIAALAARLAH
jgi:DNA-binding NtrC family response regulator